MIARITHKVEVSSIQKATALRDRLNGVLDEDADTTVILTDVAQDLPIFTVKGVDLKTKEPFEETVEAEDREAATTEIETADRVVAWVQEARVGAVNE